MFGRGAGREGWQKHTALLLSLFSYWMSEGERRCDYRPHLIPGRVAKQSDMHRKRPELLALSLKS